MMNKDRIYFVDYFKALLMILVIVGHINFANTAVKAWIYSFHMPAFFFATGLLLKPYKLWRGVLRKYTDRLVLPYVLWGMVFASFTLANLVKVFYGSYWSISNAGALTSLWFLPVMFVAVMLYHLLSMLFGTKFNFAIKIICAVLMFTIGFILPVFPIGYPGSINVAFVALGFMLFANVSSPVIFEFYESCKEKNNGCLPFVLLLLFFAATFVYRLNDPEQGYVLMGNARYGNPLLFVASSVMGILAVLLLSIFIDFVTKEKRMKLLSFVGQNTLCIFCVQKPIISLLRYLLKNIQMHEWTMLAITTILTLLISCFVCMFINKYFPIFVGKQDVFYKK